MLFVADIGNTTIKIGLYDGEEIVNFWHLSTDKNRSADEYGIMLKSIIEHSGAKKLTGAILSSVVVELTEIFRRAVEYYLKVDMLVLSHKTNSGIVLDVETPSSVGADRIANACAMSKLYGSAESKAFVAVDFGTATTFDVVVDKDRFIGGVITPGINISAKSLTYFTSLLPQLRVEPSKSVIGRNTIDNMLSGVVRGHAAMVSGLIEQIEQELGQKVIKIASGGASPMVVELMKQPFDFINPHLTLQGLKMIYEMNCYANKKVY